MMSSLLYIDIYRFITLLDSHVKMNFPSKIGPMKNAMGLNICRYRRKIPLFGGGSGFSG
jgi:hypothetical protein